MTNKKILALMFTATLMLAGCGGDDDDPIPSGKSNNNKNVVKAGVPAEVTRLEFPRLRDIGNNIVVVHKTSDSYSDGVNYSIEWDIEKKSQRWSCYQMMRGYQVTGIGRYSGDAIDPEYPFRQRPAFIRLFQSGFFLGFGLQSWSYLPLCRPFVF